MTSPLSGGRWRRSDVGTPTNSSLSASRSTLSSSASTASRRSASTPTATIATRNTIVSAARSVADAFFGCFSYTELEKNARNTFIDSPASSPSSRQRRSSNLSIYGSSNGSTHSREPGSVKFTIGEILKATKNFSPTFKIGQGGFGTVYKGLLRDGTVVAVKRAQKIENNKHFGMEFQTEVRTLTQVEHLNLVRFYGFLEHGDERILVVEYVANGTLREHLDCIHGNVLDFASRLDIAIDVAHAVTYLHMYTDPPIIHRDIKSSNILLTENLRAKVADFGFARTAADREAGATHVSTQVKGTAGYLDPEYLRTYQLTEKSDVYSFGIMLVELITGRRPIETKREVEERITAKWALTKFANGDAIAAFDPRLVMSPANNFAMEKIFELSLQCLAGHRKSRPSMKECAELLWSIRKDYKELSTSDVIME